MCKRTFDVSVQLLVIVQVIQTTEQFPKDNHNVVFRNRPGSHQVRTATTRAKLHDDPQVRALQKRAIVSCHVRGVELGQDCNFLDNVLDFIFGIFNIDDFDSNSLPRAIIDTII